VRQPQVVVPLATLAAALVLVAPVVPAARALVVALAFLLEFLSDGSLPTLTALTRTPTAGTLDATTDRVRPTGLAAVAPLVLVHGLAPEGKDDPRLRRAAQLLARAGFDVAVPTIPGLTRGRLRPEDAAPVVAALAARPGRARLVSVSVGAAPAFLAAAHPAVRDGVALLLALGPHASALELIRYHLTGEYAWNGVRGRVPHDPEVARSIIEANSELADPVLRLALTTGEAPRVEAALAALPDATRELITRLSPERVAGEIRAPIVLVHGRDDPAVPYTESLRLAAARPEGTRVVIVGAIAHVGRDATRLAGATDLARLLGVVYALLTVD
jgi:pimeloyl-ACP methyl ester carboxylesterase